MNRTPPCQRFLSTPRSVVIFCVVLCLVVVGATGSVFAYRNYELEAQDSAARERGIIERNAAASSNASRVSVPWTVSYFGKSEVAPAILTTPIASSQRSMPGLLPKSSTARMSAPPNPSAAPSASAARDATLGQPLPGPVAPPPTIKVQCGNVQCPEREICCNASCGTCSLPGALCSQQVCGMPTVVASASCGANTCNVGEECCNSSCGICIRPGEACDTAKQCGNPIEYPFSATCGMATCNTGLVCCNPSCGTCARFGEPCSQEICG